MKVAINGAGIAGTTLAYWLTKLGHEVLLVERSPCLRAGGYLLNFWGLGYDVAEKMGLAFRYLLDEVPRVPRDLDGPLPA